MLSFTPGVEFVPGELLVNFRAGVNLNDIQSLYSQFGLNELREFDFNRADNRAGVKHLRIPEQITERLISLLERSPWVEYAEPNYILTAASVPSDPSFGTLWGLDNTGQSGGLPDADIDAPAAWDITTGSSNVVVFVIDTGVDYNHPDLIGNIWTNPGEIAGNGVDDDVNGYVDDIHGINSITGSGDPMDDNNHGTHVAGTIGATGNDVGVVGVNWDVSIGAAKFLGANGSGAITDAIECFNYINSLKTRTVNPVNVVITNNSWSGGAFSQALLDAMNGPAGMPDILHAVAAGNANSNNDAIVSYPSGYNLDNIIAVAATDRNDKYASFSSYGATSVDIAAPGVSILSTTRNGAYASFNGTSMATPHVAGAAALISAAYPDRTAAQLKQDLMRGADPLGPLGNNWMKATVTDARLNVHQSLLDIAEIDGVAPSAVANLAAAADSMSSVILTWSATGDDGGSGTARAYEIRYATSPITTEAGWNAATRAAAEPRPQAPGSAETFTVRGLQRSTTYYFALKVRDNKGNESPLSNVASTTTEAGTTIFSDGFEANLDNWTPQAPWGRSTSVKRSGNYSATDSPSGNYSSNANTSLTSDPINLTGYSEAQLSFWHRYALESNFDFGRFEASKDGGTTWTTLASYTGTNTTFNQVTFNLSNYVGNADVRFRFRLESDFIIRADGWYVDDVLIVGEVIPASQPPVANSQVVTTTEEVARGITLVGSDPEGNPLTYVIVNGPAHGSLSGTAPNLTYTPVTNYSGNDSFTFKVNDGTSDSNIATVSIEVTPVDDSPVAVNDSYTVTQAESLVIPAAGVLTNDDDADGDPLTAELVAGPSNGALTLNADGSFTYLPDSSFIGIDSFTYRASDGELVSAPATVSIIVEAINDAPQAANDSYSTNEDVSLNVSAPGVLFNDSDANDDVLTAILVSSPAHGSLTLNADGSFTYTPNANYSGSDSFTYKANDGELDSAPATVSISVAAVNDAPTAVNDSYTVAQGTSLVIPAAGVLANDGDIDGGALAAVLGTGASNGSLVLNANGSFTYTPNDGFYGADSFTYRANDGAANSNLATVSITVSPLLYLSLDTSSSSTSTTTVGGVTIADEDIVAFNGTGFSLYFDGSAKGLSTSLTLDAFAILPGGQILLSFNGSATISGVSGTVDDSDIVRYTPGSGFAWYFDGSDVGLSTDDEDVSAVELLASGDLLISTVGSFSVPGVSGTPQDILRFTPSSLGSTTAGTWQMHFDGSDVGLSTSGEVLGGVAQDASGKVYLSTTGDFSVPGRSGADEDVFSFTPTSLGTSTSGSYGTSLFFDGSAFGVGGSHELTGIDLPPAATSGTTSAAALVLEEESPAPATNAPAKKAAALLAREEIFATYFKTRGGLLAIPRGDNAQPSDRSVAISSFQDAEPKPSTIDLALEELLSKAI